MDDLMAFIKSDRAERHVRLGKELVDNKQWEEAQKEFLDALALFEEQGAMPRVSQMLSSIALCCFALKRYDEASNYLCSAITVLKGIGDEEGEATAHLGLGDVLLEKGDQEGALDSFERALTLFARNNIYDGMTYAYKGMKRVYEAMGDVARAEEAEQRADEARRKLTTSIVG